ncbi:fasciclin domain-containing protein [Saccharicrinis sp. GN24d3]|uniref:fasciclin domain-containing protein n=1 Tax=Saccharicrinis sp. GN24d3 TaxID=3458416 RepID=UPI00403604F1
MKRIIKLSGIVISTILLVFIAGVGCDDGLGDKTFLTTDELTIAQTLDASPEKFSTFVEMLHLTGYYTSLQSYGSYTCFVPVNEVLDPYIKERWGVNLVSELTTQEQIEEVKELVKFHTMAKSVGASGFIEGRMPDTTYTGDYLTSSYLLGGGIGNLIINREAKFLQYDIRSDNGYIHCIDKVLTPYSDPVPVVIERAGKHTIFIEALKKTGLYDDFSVKLTETGNKKNFTIFAETDSVFALSGINSFDDLADKYAEGDTDYEEVTNGLNRWMAYHATVSFLYSADIPDEGYLSTVLENNAIKVDKNDDVLKINESETGGEVETWVSLVSDYSNYPAKNGVYHTVDTLMDIFIPKAKHILFDPVSSQPEYISRAIRSMNKVTADKYSEVDWYPPTNKVRFIQRSKNVNLDWNFFDMGGCVWYEFITPILAKGKYEFLVCSNGGNNARGKFQVYWDDEPVGSIYDVTKKASQVGAPDSVAMEANGWRLGKEWITNKAGTKQSDSNGCMRFIITKELLCPVQKRHKIKLVAVKSGGIPLDYFEFIPVD